MKREKISLYATALYTILVFAIMLYAGEPGKLFWWLLAIPFLGWAIGPHIVFYKKVSAASSGWQQNIWFIFQCLFFVGSLAAYYDGFFVNLDAQSGLLFVFMPLFQYIGIIILLMVLQLINFVGKMKGK